MVCLLLFSVGSVQSSFHLSVGFRVCSVQCQFSVCRVQGVYCSVGHSPSVLFRVFRALAVTKSVMLMSCPESTLWTSSAPAQFLNFNIPSTTGHLRTKYKVKKYIKKSTYLSMHNDTFWYIFIFGRHSPGEPTSAPGSQEGILISVFTVSHCGSPM